MMNSENLKSSCYKKPKTHLKLSFESGFILLGLIFSTASLFVFITDIASANTAVENDQIPPQTIRTDPNGLYRLELLRAEISAPKGTREEKSKKKLRRLIEQVRSVQFESEIETVEAPVVHDKAPMPEPNETLSETSLQKMQKPAKKEIEQPHKGISDLTRVKLKNSLQHPDQLNNPFELGEILFSSGNTKDAVLFYREALRRMDPNDVRLSQDRAWILFQLGNCLRNHEPPAAAETYRKLLIEYPHSPWAPLAKAQRELIAWRLQERPHKWITEQEYTGSQGN